MKNARFRWCKRGVRYDVNPGVYISHLLKDSFFENCQTGIHVNLQNSTLTLSNVKKCSVTTDITGSGYWSGSMSTYCPGATLDSSFAGLTRNDAVTGGTSPPDTQIAVRPSHVVMEASGGIAIYNKQGQKLVETNLFDFFYLQTGGETYPKAGAVDARIVYDPNWGGGRFIAAAHDPQAGAGILLAVSESSDPYGNDGNWKESKWKKYVVTNCPPNLIPEFPTLGVDTTGIYLWSLRKSGDSTVAAVKKSWLGGSTRKLGYVFDPASVPAGKYVHPVLNQDASAPGGYAWFLAEDPSNSRILYGRLQWSADTPFFLESGNSWPSITIPAYGWPGTDGMPQSCGSTIQSSRALTHALPVTRNGYMWFCHDVMVTGNGEPSVSGDRSAIQWFRFQFLTNGASVTIGNPISGRIFDGAGTPWNYYDGSIAVNSQGHMVVGFSGSKSSSYAGAFFAARLNSGQVVSPYQYKAGLNCYNSQSGSPAPWGDYSATCVDPSDDSKFWTAQEYAENHTGQGFPNNARWGTYIGKVSPF